MLKSVFAISTWLFALAACFVVAASGCAESKHAAATREFREPFEPRYRGALTSGDDVRMEAGFATVATGEAEVQVPQPAGPRGRWSDVRSAVVFACDDIEAAVVREREQPWGWQFAIRTVEDWPGTVVIRRTDDERVYEASVRIGWLGDRTDRAEALLRAIDAQMRAFGKKRRLPE